MSRLAGRFLQIKIDDFSLRVSKVNPKEVAMEQLVRHMERDCPKCVGCGEIKLHEQEDHMRMAKLFGVSCKQNVRNNGDMVRCPDGFYGIYDAIAKEVKEVRLEMPAATYGFGSVEPRMVIEPHWAPVKEAEKVSVNDEFLREYMTSPSLAKDDMELMQRMIEEGIKRSAEEQEKRAAEEQEKILRRKIMSEFGDGHSKIAVGLDSLLKPATRIPSDRSSFPSSPKRNKDVPMTSEEETW